MKRCFISCAIREIQVKTMSYHYRPVRMTGILNADMINAGVMGSSGSPHTLLMGMGNGAAPVVYK